MSDYNHHVVTGRLTRDPELKHALTSGTSFVNITIASTMVSGKGDDKRESKLFANYVFFGKRAETIAQYCSKGSHLLLEGRPVTESWTNKSGDKLSTIKFIGDKFVFLSSNKTREKEGESVQNPPSTSSTAPGFTLPAGPVEPKDIPF